MSDPNADLVSRGRAIFERLRSQEEIDVPDVPEELPTEPDAEADPAAESSPAGPALETVPEPLPDVGPDPALDPGADDGDPETGPVALPEPVDAADAGEVAEVAVAADGATVVPVATMTPPAPAQAPDTAVDLGLVASETDVGDKPLVEAEAPVSAAEPEPGPAPRPLPRVIAVANQKGGVGKTTTAVNLGACLADIGYRVLVVDLDPQGNASTGLGINPRSLQTSMYDVILHDTPIDDCVEATSVRNLFVAPASLDLAGAEIELVPAFSRELRLRRALEEVRDDYDFVLIDCPPSLGLLTVNGLAAAGEVLVPIQCEYYALEGLGQLIRNVNLVQKNLNPTLELSTIVLVMYDGRTKLSDQVVREVRAHFGDKVCRNVVPRTVRLSEAPSFGQPIIAFDATSRGAIAYRELAKEVSGGTPQRAG